MQANFKGFSTKETDFKALLTSYTKHWKWFLLSILAALSVAYVYIRYKIPEYKVQAKIKVLEEKNGSPEMSIYKDLDLFGAGKNKVEDEIEVLNSRSNYLEVVKQLGINVVLRNVGTVTESEIYRTPPIKLSFLEADSIVRRARSSFYLDISSTTTFGFSEEQDGPVKVYSFGKAIPTDVGEVIITTNVEHFNSYKGKKIKVEISPLVDVALAYKTRTSIAPAQDFSNIVNLSLNDPIPQKAIDVLNTLIGIYNKNAIDDKRVIAERTFDFINDRIADISGTLTDTDENAEQFQTRRGVVDINAQTSVNLTVGAQNSQELQNATTQLNIASSMKEIVSSEDGYQELPSNVGLNDPTIAANTAKYNELVRERKRLLKNANEQNPMIINLDQQLDGLKNSVASSVGSMVNNLSLQVNSLSNNQRTINSRIYSAPSNARALRDITRKQETTESLFLYLLQRREESQVGLASTSPQSKIIDNAYRTSRAPVSPKKSIVYLAFLIVGFAIPFSILYANDLLDDKVHNKTGLEKMVKDIPVLAELPRLAKKESKLIRKDDRSVLAESLRILRTNLDYLMKSKRTTGKNNVVYVTSSVSGEGKTFLSSNLAMIFANTGKRVLLIGADIRNPKLYTFFDTKDVDNLDKNKKAKRSTNNGLTEYLYDDSIEAKDIVNSLLVQSNTIDVVYSGKIPPNPAELLMSERMKDLMTEMSEEYDYVIVDTAPLMVVTDTLLISDYADHMIYVTRAGVTETRVLEFPSKLKAEGKLNGLCFVVNDVKESNLGYGGKYGYGYGKSLKKWWKF
ncbi:polysaccharide biosynthesis tyrosine autokinase [Aggregatimonas sangjinii]|uniref:non-specific protein-tyrosine kinase n=1 Tax=Aggregatimonas sangjinii TaxID=2583587 RepID=A0A5B7SS54_9FLAO|nr:tyrosine-protein kinase family protein [Aggregatimonas sangjinii]QCW99679.1 polysaccharide biosynthesis tyrosine autokinase [Aggregatimonas sangjinii]